MNRVLLTLAFLLAISSAAAFEDYSAASYLDLEASWTGLLTADTEPGARLSSLEARVSLAPTDATTDPDATYENDTYVFRWDTLEPRYTYTIGSNTRTQMSGGLSASEPWPTDIRDDVPESELIDYEDPSVRAFAAQIAEGETDALRLAVRAAEAVRREITYNLTTLNADATYPASEVLARGEGVCDEITVLYIATMRALGVPARYVSGYAYTNIFENDGSWEGHGWAEVYIAGEWVPFDLTYAQYVHLSPDHLVVRRSDDARSSTISYTWYGSGVDIDARQLENDITVIDRGPDVRFGTIDAAFAQERVGPGWNALEITVNNELDSFIAPVLRLSRTQGLEHADDATIIVPPRSSRTIALPVRISETLRSRFEYTFPMTVNARGFESERATFRASTRWQSYEEPRSDEEFESHPDLDFSCSDVLGLPGTIVPSICDLFNIGNRNLDLRVCGDSCLDADVLIGERRSVDVPVRIEDGVREETIRVVGDIRTETTIGSIGREPAQVRMDVTNDENVVIVDVTSSAPVNGTITVRVGTQSWSSGFEDSRFEIPNDAFGLRGAVDVHATYADVDGEHALSSTTSVEQTIIEYVAVRLEKLLSFV